MLAAQAGQPLADRPICRGRPVAAEEAAARQGAGFRGRRGKDRSARGSAAIASRSTISARPTPKNRSRRSRRSRSKCGTTWPGSRRNTCSSTSSSTSTPTTGRRTYRDRRRRAVSAPCRRQQAAYSLHRASRQFRAAADRRVRARPEGDGAVSSAEQSLHSQIHPFDTPLDHGRTHGDAAPAPRSRCRHPRKGGNVGALVDQKFTGGLHTTFFGRPCETNPVVPMLARRFDCDVHPTRCIRLPGNRYRLEIRRGARTRAKRADGDIDIDASTQLLNDVVEGWVREHPGQWMWFHKRWTLSSGRRSRRWKAKPGSADKKAGVSGLTALTACQNQLRQLTTVILVLARPACWTSE